MRLSPFAQYCIRKLLRQNTDGIKDLLKSEVEAQLLSEVSLNKILNHLYLDEAEVSTKIEEIEALTKLYQDLEKAKADRATLTEIQRRIFQLLGLKTTAENSSRLPISVHENSVNIFRFYYAHQVREGIRFNSELYGLVYEFQPIHQLYVYQLAWVLSSQGVPLRLTTSPARYRLWVNLRSPAYAALLKQDANQLKIVLSLYAVLQKCKSTIVRRSLQRVSSY